MENSRYEQLQKQVTEFHKKNPEVWEKFVYYSFELINKGFKNYSVSGVFDRIRWESGAGEDGEANFKIGNNFKPFYARRFMKIYPQADGFYRLRRQTTKDKPPLTGREVKPGDLEYEGLDDG